MNICILQINFFRGVAHMRTHFFLFNKMYITIPSLIDENVFDEKCMHL